MKDKFNELRNKYSKFIYDSYIVNNSEDRFEVIYTFILGEHVFNPKITILKKDITNTNIDYEYLDYLFFQYGLFDLMNYYKLTCAKEIIIKPYYINDEQINFFKKILYNGLGEYFYKNNIDLEYDEFVSYKVESDKHYNIVDNNNYSGNLIPIGGGKDSIVTMELLKNYHDDNKLFMLDRNLYPKNKAGYDSIYTAGYSDNDIVIFDNSLDLKMIELNKQGYLNGHIPFSACVSIASFILAYLNNKKYIVLSNEASANEGNCIDSKVNHQYSKSYEYEHDFQEYSKKYLNENIFYFSLLRCFNESQIVNLFLKNKDYLKVFRSCNRGTKTNSWCCQCSKCLYVYIMLYPYLNKNELLEIFDHDLLDDKSLENVFLDLVVEGRVKPFECVGTKLEINYSLGKALEKSNNLPYLLKLYKDNYYVKVDDFLVENYFNKENSIPEEFLKLVGDNND